MTTDKIHSKHKFFGGFGLLIGLNFVIGIGTYELLTASKISIDKVDLINNNNARVAYTVILGLQLLFFLLFMTQNRFIITDTNGITFINPLFPFLKKTKTWNEFDYFITVDEKSRYSTHEAVWLIKDKKIKGRFSSFYYSNYSEIKRQMKTNWKGKKHFDPFSQLFALLGLKKIIS